MKRILALILMICLLSGCALAVPGRAGRDDLSGFLITMNRQIDGEWVDVWDEEAAGMKMISNHTLAGQKLYARQADGEHISYEFPEGCGLYSFTYAEYRNGELRSRSTAASPEVGTEHFALDLGEPLRFDMETVIYATRDTKATIFVNPVYQTADGEVYALSDKPTGYQVLGEDGGFMALLTQGEEDSQTRVRVTVKYVVLPESYVVIEMDENDCLLRQSEFAPGELPESYAPGSDAAYLILEARAGADTVRTVHSPGDKEATLDTYYPGQYGFCIKGYTKIEWEGA